MAVRGTAPRVRRGHAVAAAEHPAARPRRRGDRRAARGDPAVGGGVGPGRARAAARRVQEGRRPRGWRQPDSLPGLIDDYDRAWELLGVGAQVHRFSSLAAATAERCPRLVPWVTRRPVQTLRLADGWEELLATVRWIDERQSPGMYLRQVDVPGVDTKFIERHRGVLAELLDLQLDCDRIDLDATDFAARYRFRRKPGYVRFRSPEFGRFSELTVRADEFSAPPPGARRPYVVENE